MNQGSDWKLQETIIAIATDKPGKWIYITYPNWNEARIAVNAARSQGKAAVIYDGACPPIPPEI